MSLFSPSCFGMSHLRSPEVLQFGQLCSCSAVFVLCCVLLGATLPSPGCAMMSPQNSRLRQVVFTGQNQDTWLPSTMISYSAEQNQLRGPATGSGHYRRERSTSTPNIKHPDRQGCARPGNCLPCGLLPWGRKQAPSPVWSSVIGNKPVLCSTTILLHEDLFFETSGEFFGVWERLSSLAQAPRCFHFTFEMRSIAIVPGCHQRNPDLEKAPRQGC